VGTARLVDAAHPGERVRIESFTREPGRHMPHAHRLEWYGRKPLPTGCGVDLRGEPARVLEVAAQALLQPLHALLADEEPELERPEAAAEWNAPVAEVPDFRIRGRAQVAGIGRHHAHQVLRIAHEVGGAVERSPQPFV